MRANSDRQRQPEFELSLGTRIGKQFDLGINDF
jgi:hypothetical protein